MLNPAASQITEKLSNMLIRKRLACLQFDNQFVLDKQIGQIVAENSTILVQHLQPVLLLYSYPGLLQAMR